MNNNYFAELLAKNTGLSMALAGCVDTLEGLLKIYPNELKKEAAQIEAVLKEAIDELNK